MASPHGPLTAGSPHSRADPLNGVSAFTGRASRPIARLLKRHGRQLIAAPESFVVGSQSMLLDGEAARARRWGMTLGAVSKTYLPAPA